MRVLFPSSSFVFLCLVACGGKVPVVDDDGASPSQPPDVTAPEGGIDNPAPPVTATLQGQVIVYSIDEDTSPESAASPFFPLVPLTASTAPALGCVAAPSVGEDPPSRDAGSIEVTAAASLLDLMIPYDAAKHSYDSPGALTLIPGGSTITVSSTGGADLPGFSATVDALAPLAWLAPTDGQAIAVTEDLAVRWTPSGDAPIEIALGLPGGAVFCAFAAADGVGIIPAALVANATVEPCTGGECLVLQVGRHQTQTTSSGPFAVEIVHHRFATRSLPVTQ